MQCAGVTACVENLRGLVVNCHFDRRIYRLRRGSRERLSRIDARAGRTQTQGKHGENLARMRRLRRGDKGEVAGVDYGRAIGYQNHLRPEHRDEMKHKAAYAASQHAPERRVLALGSGPG